MVKIKIHYPSLSLQNRSSNSHRATAAAAAATGKTIHFPCHPSKLGTKPNTKINKNFESVGRNKKKALEPAKQKFEKAESSYKVDSGETAVKNGLHNTTTAIEVKGLDDEVGSQKPTDQGEKERLVIRWKLTADGKAKIIKNLNCKPRVSLEGNGDHEAKTEREISFITAVFNLILEDMNKNGKSIFKKQDRKVVQETSRERFKICTPRWKPTGKPKISLGAPGLCSRSTVAYGKVF